MPTVCVVVPVYKAEKTIDRCVASVVGQQFPAGSQVELRCILVEDQSPDQSGALCDAWAAKDARVQVLHQAGPGGVSRARNAGLAAAEGDFVVFLDADDTLRPGALAAALAVQAAHPCDFVLWHYTMEQADETPVTGDSVPRPATALARLWLDCLLAMPWNKLYQLPLAKQVPFDTRFTLGEDLQFVLDYIALLRQTQPGFCYQVLTAPLNFYDCSNASSLSSRYHADYCEIWPLHFAKLNAAATAAGAPQEDMLPLHRAELTVLAEGVADILRRDSAPLGQRRDKAAAALRTPWLRGLLNTMRAEHCYHAYYLPVRWRNQQLLYTMAEAKRTGSALYGHLDWLGYYLLLGRMAHE